MEKKNYVCPTMDVVAFKMQGSLLAGSGPTKLESDFDDVNSYGSSDLYD